MDGENGRYMAEIKAAIKAGTLTGSEMRRRLMLTIDNELNKPEGHADMEFVRVAHTILREMHRSTIVVNDETLEASLQAAQRKMATTRKRRNAVRVTGRTILATAAILVLMIIADGVFHWEWLGSHSTDDEQQYVITGHEIDPQLMEKGSAGNVEVQPNEISTVDLDEAISLLGFKPPMPAWFPDGWVLEDYYAFSSEYSQIFVVSLRSQENNETLSYRVNRFSNAEDALVTFEQNELGMSTLINGWSVYTTKNINRNVAVWYEGNICYSLHASITEDNLIQIIQSINKEE